MWVCKFCSVCVQFMLLKVVLWCVSSDGCCTQCDMVIKWVCPEDGGILYTGNVHTAHQSQTTPTIYTTSLHWTTGPWQVVHLYYLATLSN